MEKKWLTIGIILLFVGTCIIPATAMTFTRERSAFTFMNKTITLTGCSHSETELKYYEEEGLSLVVGIPAGEVIWKSGIRLTQDEMAMYSDWTLTKVNVAFCADYGSPSMTVRIYIYDKGTATHPGPVIANDTTYTLNCTGITTIPLATPVNLCDHEELWIAVEWNETLHNPGIFYAWLDTISGPHVPMKGDFIYLNNVWTEIYTQGPNYDGNWGIGAIIEGTLSELSIGNIEGPIGITANVSNIGVKTAVNVSWSIAVTGGLLFKVNVLETGMISSLAVGSSNAINTGIFFGLGEIYIVIITEAKNAPVTSVKKTAFLLGPFVVGIR